MIQVFDPEARSSDVAAALLRDGGAIVVNQAPLDVTDRIMRELRKPLDDQGHLFENDFNGYKTRRMGAVLGLSRTSAKLIASPSPEPDAKNTREPSCSMRGT